MNRAALLVLAVCPLSGCHRTAPPAPAPGASASPAATTYRVTGKVRAVNQGAGIVTIRHDAIPGYMDAMTMPFEVRDKALLDEVRSGDEVEGTLRVSGEDSVLTELSVTRPALPQAVAGKATGGDTPAARLFEVGEMVPDFALTTQDAKTLHLSDLRGEVVALTFIYTRCPLPDFCPLMDRKFAQLASHLSAFPERAKHVRLLSVSFDPEHDTPDVLRKHATVQGAKPPLWTFAVAAHEELAKVAPGLGLTYGPAQNEVIHNLVTVVIGPDGKLAARETGKTWKPAELLKVIYSLLPKHGGAGPS